MKHAESSYRCLFATEGVITDLFILAAVWLSAIIIINPNGDFPLNDDWQYAAVVNCLLHKDQVVSLGSTLSSSHSDSDQSLTSKLRFILANQWAIAMTHVAFGTLACMTFGFSFTVLRYSTLFMAFFGIWATYLLLRLVDGSRWFAFVASLCLAFNPVYFVLSNTFMTDVPFTAWCVIATFFFARSILFETFPDIILGFFFCVGAVLNRQIGLAILLAFALAMLLQRRMKALFVSVFVIIMVSFILIAIQAMLPNAIVHPHLKNELLNIFQRSTHELQRAIGTLHAASFYLGFFLFPILVQLLAPRNGSKMCSMKLVPSFMTILGIGLIFWNRIMPLKFDYLQRSGMGPVTLSDVLIWHLPNAYLLPSWLWALVTVVSLLGGSILLACLISAVWNSCNRSRLNLRSFMEDKRVGVCLFFIFATGIYLLPLLLIGFYDRYLMPPLVFICGAIAPFTSNLTFPRNRLIVIGVALSFGLLMILGVTGTRDYLAWNRIRWIALHELLDDRGIASGNIDGGYEFNGWYRYFPHYSSHSTSKHIESKEDYFVSMGQVPGYHILHRYNVLYWLPPREGPIYVLKRSNGELP